MAISIIVMGGRVVYGRSDWAINFAKKTAIYSVSAGFYKVSTR